jgi:hypothetical protein
MINNKLTINFKSTECNGFPSIKILHNNNLLIDYTLESYECSYTITIDLSPAHHTIIVERYNKTENNPDQILEITNITVDGITIPEFLLLTNSKFEFDDQVHYGSKYFSPNGIWSFNFNSPVITYILDQKILHEAKYNQDYQYPWSYKLGPDSVAQISANIDLALEQVNKL